MRVFPISLEVADACINTKVTSQMKFLVLFFLTNVVYDLPHAGQTHREVQRAGCGLWLWFTLWFGRDYLELADTSDSVPVSRKLPEGSK